MHDSRSQYPKNITEKEKKRKENLKLKVLGLKQLPTNHDPKTKNYPKIPASPNPSYETVKYSRKKLHPTKS